MCYGKVAGPNICVGGLLVAQERVVCPRVQSAAGEDAAARVAAALPLAASSGR